MKELDRYERFVKWAKERGHYQAHEAALRFEAYEASRKENEKAAMLERSELNEAV